MNHLFDYGTLRETSIATLLAEISVFNEKWVSRNDLAVDVLSDLAKKSSVQSVGSSTRIEGSTMTDDEVATLLNNMEIRTLQSRDEEEVAGYIEVVKYLYESPPHLEFTSFNICGLHNELMRFSSKDTHHRGRYKQLTNRVVTVTPEGEERTIFRTTEPMFVEREMDAMVAWYAEHKDGHAYHPLLVIAAVVYEFLTIHPFQDGNGRLSRLITTLLLLSHGYDFVRYVSLERIIEARKRDYYRSLMNGQQWRGTEYENAGSWTVFFLKAMVEASKTLERNLQQGGSLQGGDLVEEVGLGHAPMVVRERPVHYLSVAEEKVLRYFDKHEHLTIKQLDELLPKVSRSTAKNRLRKLHELGLLRRRGKGRATSYERV